MKNSYENATVIIIFQRMVRSIKQLTKLVNYCNENPSTMNGVHSYGSSLFANYLTV